MPGPQSPPLRFETNLTNTIRARSQLELHQEAGHTTVPDLHSTDLRSKSGLPTGGRPHRACLIVPNDRDKTRNAASMRRWLLPAMQAACTSFQAIMTGRSIVMTDGTPSDDRAATSLRAAQPVCYRRMDARDPPSSISAPSFGSFSWTPSGGCTRAPGQGLTRPATPERPRALWAPSRGRFSPLRIVTLSSQGTILSYRRGRTADDSAGWTIFFSAFRG